MGLTKSHNDKNEDRKLHGQRGVDLKGAVEVVKMIKTHPTEFSKTNQNGENKKIKHDPPLLPKPN